VKTKIIYAAFILGVMAAGSLIGASFIPGEWYASLIKPSWTPPNWVFGPVWTVLYAMIGFVGARKFLTGGAWWLWVGQLALNLTWSPVFFGLHLMATALAIITSTLLLVLIFIAQEWRRDPLSARLFIPYALWLAYASTVNAGTFWLN
jgi:tryptophan-rich sensory protein